MHNFFKVIEKALWNNDSSLIGQAQQEHDLLVAKENQEFAKLVEEIDRVKREDNPATNPMAVIYLESLQYDLERIQRNQRRRVGAMDLCKAKTEI